jgi:large subunit ribosomal protein L4e
MFAPTKIWRKFHVKVPLLQKRYATVSAIAATALPALVMARGHLISEVEEIPLVVGNHIEKVSKTKEAFALLKTLGAADEISKVLKSKKLRAGKGKYRNRRHRQRLGPLVVYGADEGVTRGFKNLPGVDVCDVRNLNLLQLAPGGHLGRFVIWSEGAIALLDELWGTQEKGSELKKGYK